MAELDRNRPIVLITGAAGDLGSTLAQALGREHRVIGMDRAGASAHVPLLAADLTDARSVEQALAAFRERYGSRIASVIHLAAYFDFSGEEHPLYRKVNVEGTRSLLRALQAFDVEQFAYSGTMLVHEAARPGERIDESRPIAPKWAYPRSKAEAEEVIRSERGRIPVVLLHLAGVYDEQRCVPTLAQQIRRIYERDLQSHLYSGDVRAGQSMLHKEDMADAFRRVVERRGELPDETVILIGEPDAMGYDELQDEIGRLLHGDADWATLRVPKPAARLGAALQESLEPVIPDAIDQGEKPFVRPFMVGMADDHYALDIGVARRLLGWEPRHRIRDKLPALVESLKRDPVGWYRRHGITPPGWVTAAAQEGEQPEALRERHEEMLRTQHAGSLWAHWLNIALGAWLATSPPILGLGSQAMTVSDVAAGLVLMVCGAFALSWRHTWARWACAAVGLWLLTAPLLFWAPSAAGYLNDTLAGMLAIGLALLVPPEPGVSPLAATRGPDSPPGWSFNPSTWTQRLPVIALALVGLLISRYLTAYQLGHIDSVWEPFFPGGPDPRNGTEEIITSSVSQAWPVPDAGLGALTYALEILTGIVGSQRRWRTMPALVLLFGLMIVPLGVVSIFFIIIQPIWIGTWCTLCLIASAAMLVQIPYSLDELLASTQFLLRRHRAGRNVWQVLLAGDTDEQRGGLPAEARPFERPARDVLKDMVQGGVGLPWNLMLTLAVGVWLMFTRLTLGAQGAMANADHLIGSLAVTIAVIACAEPARPARFLNAVLGAALLVTPWVYGAGTAHTVASIAAGLALMLLSVRRGAVRDRYDDWNRYLV